MTLYCEGDCHVALVATEVRRRKRGLATALMALALREARDAGCTTTTLQATAGAAGAYERLGYRRLGGLEMWERRRIPPPARAPAGLTSTAGSARSRLRS